MRRPEGSDPLDPEYMARKVRHAEGVTVWASFSAFSKPRLVVLNKKEMMRQGRYCEVRIFKFFE